MARKKRKQGTAPKREPKFNPFADIAKQLSKELAVTEVERPAAPPPPQVAAPPAASQPPVEAFASAMRGVTPLAGKTGRVRPKSKRPPVAEIAMRSVNEVAEEATFAMMMNTADRPHWAGQRGAEAVEQLRRGAWPVDKEVDLHGLRAHVAERRLRAFVAEARQRRWRCVRVIHGQGLHSAGDPVLRGACRSLLKRLPEHVDAWCEAMPDGGGAGATLVAIHSS
ncbi:MAG: Smr/MutS family protein [Myxococcales bacterium]|nr:Smr/MutS family protein [Myxococcales bacterium]